MRTDQPLLEVIDLRVEFPTRRGTLTALDGISFTIAPGEVLGVVGESGAGKSLTGAAIIGLLEPPGRIASGEVRLQGLRIDTLAPREMRKVRGREIGAIFQDPLTSLNPLYTVGRQLVETIQEHLNLSAASARARAIDLLRVTGIPAPEERIRHYPHQFSGGMRQRVVIALALAAEPKLVIADEPTTALDVSIQAQIITLLRDLCRKQGTAVMLVTHDMGVIAETADRVAVMYAGRIAEIGPVTEVIHRPRHPYTAGLMGSIPTLGEERALLEQIDGSMPRLDAIPEGCAFNPRCPRVMPVCRSQRPPLMPAGASLAACWLHDPAHRILDEPVRHRIDAAPPGEIEAPRPVPGDAEARRTGGTEAPSDDRTMAPPPAPGGAEVPQTALGGTVAPPRDGAEVSRHARQDDPAAPDADAAPSTLPPRTSSPGAPLVSAEHLTMTFDVSAPWLNRILERQPRQLLHAVDDISFDIHTGETLALVGESGCGKSTVARLLVGLYPPTRGRIVYHDPEQARSQTAPPAIKPASRRQAQMIFQDPYASLNPRWKVADIIAEPIRVHLVLSGRDTIRDRVIELLELVGLSAADASKYPHQFSGGQRQRISIARALASEPAFLVCDEPTSALDVSVQAQVLNLMRDLQIRHGLTYLFISHNLAVVHHVSDRVGVMYLGRIVELASRQRIFAHPRHPYTRMLLDAIPDLEMSGKARTPVAGEVPNPLTPPRGCTFHPRCPYADQRCRSERPRLVSDSVGAVACHAVAEHRVEWA